jgi:hypothetical protein
MTWAGAKIWFPQLNYARLILQILNPSHGFASLTVPKYLLVVDRFERFRITVLTIYLGVQPRKPVERRHAMPESFSQFTVPEHGHLVVFWLFAEQNNFS